MKRSLLLIPLILIPALACRISQAAPTSTVAATAAALPGTIQSDVTYCTVDGVDLKMDVYPASSPSGPAPAIVWVHGGGWTGGDKLGELANWLVPLSRAGFVGFSLNYRLAPLYKFPAMIEDVKCAIRSIRAHAADYGVNPDKIGVVGGSAGGHLVALLGTTDASAGFDVGQYMDQSSRVQAVVDLFGPSDLSLLFPGKTGAERIFGSFDLQKASPLTYVGASDPPFLILQGDKDTTVPPEQSKMLYDRLAGAGVPARLVIVKNAGHGFVPVGGAIDPNLEQIYQIILDFFKQNL